ncbi:M48 family metallopeptidase [Ferribacterium limneticum]|uniref:M48 family metallopeptidase n=1 Tax=Ferribacterium limneticum TaxID=76259 RepID=UPI001CFBDCB8|nr:SprT family zinc-dependent metalloprotease [Ferribacterium limneticum]UCV27846.1 M48 family metallopeptidase [Ferribacterium limneticum]UCV31763.1 M48 family metallopeptidase [Ferribacterium limneticum]
MPSTTPPETSHRIAIGGADVSYQLRRSQRRTIGLSIDHRGLRVGAPTRARIGDIEKLIHQHGDWVLDKLAAWRDRPAPGKLEITDGTIIPLLGEPLTIALTSVGRSRWQFGPGTLYLHPVNAGATKALLEKALREKARAVFAERLQIHAPRLGVATPPLRLSSARTRWGSCNHRGDIALNWRLVFMPLPVIDYVVCHELAHLKEMNHSPRFWSVVEQLCPDWKARRLELRQQAKLVASY